ncbi:hypothetical protein EV138_4618 [Kribbella voronezhensis]|uniref:Uncharacterized protein n=1 Tax=Kribbella voronezhensis TaxID=2512212 RepID=A0A4R7THP8_9ACTN|nr:hypothetical protein [Kribbella voronezhensis]TDU91017.1 hypothetical protein EV138_4618 [Kribbella voronezhensis]
MKVITRGVALILLVALCLSACGGKETGGGGTGGGTDTGGFPPPSTTWTPPSPPSSEPSSERPERATYQVPDEDCPGNYGHGLDIMTETPAELEYVDKIVACVNDAGTATYLRNESDAVWVLHNNGRTTAGVTHWSPTLDITSFRNVFTTRALLPPKDVITTSIPTADLEWTIDLPLSLSWEAHALVVAKIASLGKTALIDALKGRTRAGAAIAQCAFTMNELAEKTSDLADKDMSDLLLDGLGAGVAVNKCRERAAEVRVHDSSNRPIALSEDLAELKGQTKVLEAAESHLSTAKLGARVLKWIHFLPRVP